MHMQVEEKRMERLLKVCLLVLFVWRTCAQTPTTVISPPQGFNASLGSASTVFQCDVTGADNIEWRVDRTPSNRDIVTARGIVTSDVITIDLTTNTLSSTLTVPTTDVNDDTSIFCIAEHSEGDVLSATVLHLVQDLLESPPQLEINDIQDSFMRRLSWDAPETIDLTDIEPDISNYQVCFNISEEIKFNCDNVSESSQQYTFINLRVSLLFSVSAVNVVGEGNATTVEHEACDPTTVPAAVSGSEVNTQVEFQSGGNPSVIISFPQSVSTGEDEDCFNLYSVQLIPLSAADSFTLQGPFIPAVTVASGSENNQRTLSFNIDSGINPNEIYSVTIITVNVNGERNSTGDITFSSYDVQEVDVSAVAGGLILSCTFAMGSEAHGCQLRVCQRGSGDTVIQNSCQDVTILREPGPSTIMLRDLELGIYTIMEVTKIERDGNETVLNLEALQLTDVEVIEEVPTTSPTTTRPSVQTPQPLPPSSSSNVTAIIIGCIVGGIAVALLVLAIFLVVLCLLKAKSRKDKLAKQNEGYRHSQLWQEESDGRTPTVVTPTQINGASTSAETNALNPLYEDPLATIAVIQGGVAGHHNVIRTATDPQQASSTSSIGQQPNETVQHTRGPYTGDPYAVVDKAKKKNSESSNTDKNERSATSPLYTDIMRSSEKINLADKDSIEKIPLTNSERSLNSETEKPKLSFEDLKASNESLLSIGSQSSMTGAHPTYAELEHHRLKKKEKEPSDKTGVLYSEIKVDEIPPVLPQKKVRSTSSLKWEGPTPVSGQGPFV